MGYFQWIHWSMAIPLASCGIALNNMINLPAQGVQAPDGTVSFEAGLLLRDVHTTFSGIRVRQARYYFDLELPNDIGEPLKRVVIKQRSGGDDIKFKPEKTRVYLGSHRDRTDPVKAISVVDEATEEISVEFETPIPPGSKVTIGLKPKQNPDYGGVYLFGVTAFPRGEKARGMYLGAGRFHFFSDGNSFF